MTQREFPTDHMVYRDIKPFFPQRGVVFSMTLDFADEANHPMRIHQLFGYAGLRYVGSDLLPAGVVTGYFELCTVGEYPNLREALTKGLLMVRDKVILLPGSWILPLTREFRSDGRGRVILPSPMWRDTAENPYFPCLDPSGDVRFRWAGHPIERSDRLLVQIPADRVLRAEAPTR